MEYFLLELLNGEPFDVEAVAKWLESFPHTLRRSSLQGAPVFFICTDAKHKARLEAKLKDGSPISICEGWIDVRSALLVVYVNTSREVIQQMAHILLQFMKKHPCSIVDDRGTDYSAKYSEHPERLFQDLMK